MLNSVIQGDCLEKLQLLQDNSIDAIVTDPPYELGFMNKEWDKTGIAYNKDLWSECLRVLRPGGHLLAFGGSRTYHRMAVAIEDSGFEIRDQIMWVYGSGFPKSLNIGKAVDKLQGNKREDIVIKDINHIERGDNNISNQNYIRDKSVFNFDNKIVDKRDNHTSKGFSEFEGLGTSLKPSHEPIVLARKPISEKTIAENCIKWGVGGLSIDECRVGIEIVEKGRANRQKHLSVAMNELKGTNLENGNSVGRFPANFIHDGSEEVTKLFPKSNSSKQGKSIHNSTGTFVSKLNNNFETNEYGDSGSAARFFYCAKASKSERDLGCDDLENGEVIRQVLAGEHNNPTHKNNHPTVKPIKLMEYLVKLVTRENQIVLDPFGGSGTTAIACINTNRNYILIEKEPKYIEIINNRIQGHANLFTEAV